MGNLITEEKRLRIRKERLEKEASTVDYLFSLVRNGKTAKARQILIFHTNPAHFRKKIETLGDRLKQDFERTEAETRRNFFVFLTKLTLDLVSFLPLWNLKNKDLHGQTALADEDVKRHITRNEETLAYWSSREKVLPDRLLKEWLNETKSRFKVEGLNNETEAQEFAAKLVGTSILEYIDNMDGFFKKSNLRQICELRVSGQTQTEIGNDHTTNLEYAMWLGASFVTTNPQLVEVAWELNPEVWTPRVDEIISSLYMTEDIDKLAKKGSQEEIERSIEEINTEITSEVVLENAKMLRGIFLLSEGQKGLVCCQVNPLKHSDANAMTHEALYIYSKLTERLSGVPNVVFKLPATKAGLEAAKELTERGIGVTITVSFGLFQVLPFAEVINKGHAIVSYVVVMNGRLADPVIAELKKFGDNVALAGRWAGVAVAKRLYQKLYAPSDKGDQGYDSKRIRIIVASLRNYEGAFPDITELTDVPIITVFPNIRRAFDAQERKINPKEIEKPLDDAILERLLKSELFRQAYYAPDEDDDYVKPLFPFYLEDETKVLEYPPVKNTLGQFCEYRVKLGEFVKRRVSTFYRNIPP